MKENDQNLLSEVARYYTGKLTEHGESANGVDWNGEESQFRRFEQLCKIVDGASQFSINDLGCGYGALIEFLKQRYENFSYFGTDVSRAMIESAQRIYAGRENTDFVIGSEPPRIADYSIASGIFNVRLNRGDEEWRDYVESMLDVLDKASLRGFSFNCLTSYSDTEKMRDYLYYADPCTLFDLCKRKYARNVALLHDYGLYEFTVLVKKVP